MNLQEFIEEVRLLGIELNEKQLQQLEEYYELLITWNEKINLTRITEKEDVYLKHFYDSITLVKAIDLNKVQNLCDIGTGAGFPGLVLKIVFPNLKVTLIDALNKRIIFLNEVIQKLGLKDIEAIHERGEDFARKKRESYDVVTARAVKELRIIMEICIPLVKEQGYFIPMKANVEEEITSAKGAFEKLDCTLEEKITFTLPKEESLRTLLKIKKEKKTSMKYPRSNDKIEKIAL